MSKKSNRNAEIVNVPDNKNFLIGAVSKVKIPFLLIPHPALPEGEGKS